MGKTTTFMLAIAMALSVGIGHVAAQELPFTMRVSGSGTSTTIDVNGDGERAVSFSTSGQIAIGSQQQATLGSVTAQSISDLATLPEAVNCPPGNVEFALVTQRDVIRFESGDLLLTEYTSGTNCLDVTTNVASFQAQGTVIGGTGSFTNATGSFIATGTFQAVLVDASQNIFVAVGANMTGTLTLAEME